MGRSRWSRRKTVEECKMIDTPWLRRHGYFCGYKSGGIKWTNAAGAVISSIGIAVSVDDELLSGKYLRLTYTQTDVVGRDAREFDYKIELVTTPCHFGGVRYWFICPLVVNGRPCRRRVSTLYLPPNGEYFGCRHCHDLTYRSQKEHDKRIDALLTNPELLRAYSKSEDPMSSLLAIKAYSRLTKDL